MKIHNKLVRDKIPAIIEADGKFADTRILSDNEYRNELRKKAKEELEEYLHSQNDGEALEELADLLEIIHSLVEVHGSTYEDLEDIRHKKAQERGGFNDKVYLIGVKDEED